MAGAAGRVLPVGFRGRGWLLGFGGDEARRIAHNGIYFDRSDRATLLRPLWNAMSSAGDTPETAREALVDGRHSLLQNATRVDFAAYLPDDILVKVDRASMLTSLEVRAPFLDHRVIEFAYGRLPDRLRATASARKIILRRLAAKLLPPQFDSARKQGFSIPLATWLKGDWGPYVESVVRNASPDIFDRTSIDRLLQGERRGYENSHRIYTILMFELWRKTYGVTL